MRHLQALAGLAFATTLVPLAPAHAAPVYIGHGRLCAMDTSAAEHEPFTQTGTLDGGPFSAVNVDAPTVLPNPYVVCSVQVGGTGHHAEPDAAQAIDWQPGFVGYLPPTAVTFQVPSNTPVFLCSEIWIFTGSGHLTVYMDENSHTFMTDPTAAKCAFAGYDSGTYHAVAPIV